MKRQTDLLDIKRNYIINVILFCCGILPFIHSIACYFIEIASNFNIEKSSGVMILSFTLMNILNKNLSTKNNFDETLYVLNQLAREIRINHGYIRMVSRNTIKSINHITEIIKLMIDTKSKKECNINIIDDFDKEYVIRNYTERLKFRHKEHVRYEEVIDNISTTFIMVGMFIQIFYPFIIL